MRNYVSFYCIFALLVKSLNKIKFEFMIATEKQIVESFLRANGREELIAKFTQWVNELPYCHSVSLSVYGIIGDVPYYQDNQKSEPEKPLIECFQRILQSDYSR